VTVRVEDISGLLRAAWPRVCVTAAPVPLTGGFWAQMWRVQVSGQPDGVAGELVVRFAPHGELGAKEAEVQREVAAQGYATPAVWLSAADDSGSGGWWSVMEFAPGAPLIAGLHGAAIVRRAPLLVRSLPTQLAATMAALHRLDPRPVTDAVHGAAPGVAWTVPEVLDQLRLGAAAIERGDLVAALDRLATCVPAPTEVVVCHGDLHPFNVLVDGGRLTVIDWTGAVLADPCFDVAFTELLLANPPIPLPAPLARVLRRAGLVLARRFVTAYVAANPRVSLAGLGWFRALHSARILVEVSRLRAEHGADAGGHPWHLVAPAAARHLAATSRAAVKA
jgi:aminoglycoside phosphotransferase (APT) family kinase protein